MDTFVFLIQCTIIMNDEIGNRIKILMGKENISPQSFANEIGITPGGLNHILTGRNKPRYDILLKIVEKYKAISLEWLILGNLPMYKREKATFAPIKELAPPNTDFSKLPEINESKNIKERIIVNKSEKFPSVGEFSMFESIEEIRVYFKNKTYLVLKPEK